MMVSCGSASDPLTGSQNPPPTIDRIQTPLDVKDPATVDLAMLSQDNYVADLCAEDGFAAVEAGTGAWIFVTGEVEFPTSSDLAASGLLVAIATVQHVGRGQEFTPILDEDTLRYLGGERESHAISLTPVQFEVTEELVGTANGRVVTASELGCIPEGSIPSTTVGRKLVILLAPLPDGLGPDRSFRSTHRITDWFSIDGNGRLGPRLGILGAPSSAPFAIGMTVDELRAELSKSKSTGDVSQG